MVQANGNERLTAFVSTVVAVAILAAGVTAHQNAAPQATEVAQIASDLRFQLEMGFRHDLRERETRLAQLDAVMAAWNVAPQSDDDRALLVAWLREAGANSLPGVMEPLPELPKFSSSKLVLADTKPAVQPSVPKSPPSEADVPEVTISEANRSELRQSAAVQNAPTEPVATTPKSSPLYAQGPDTTKSAVTPTPADPLEEEMIALRQPQSLTLGPREIPSSQQAIAPRPEVGPQPQVVEKNLLASVPVSKDTVSAPVNVNLTELAARIAGYHDSLDEVELALLRLDTPNLAVVQEQVEKLESMTRDYGFVQLYYDSLTPRERKSIVEPRSMQATLAEVTRQLKRCEEGRESDYLGTFDGEANQEFADLRSRIAEIERRTER